MCGIFGFVIRGKTDGRFKAWTDRLFILSESRGKEASGLACLSGKSLNLYKRATRGSDLIKTSIYKRLFDSEKESPLAIIGHSRLATNGIQCNNLNNQPVFNNFGVIVHNGIITNDKILWSKELKRVPRSAIDTEAILSLIEKYYQEGDPLPRATARTFAKIEGSASIAFLVKSEPYLMLATNTGSLYFTQDKKTKTAIFASEFYILDKFTKEYFSNKLEISQVKAGTGKRINLQSLATDSFKFGENPKKRAIKETGKKELFTISDLSKESSLDREQMKFLSQDNNLAKLKKHDFDYGAIRKIRRCTRCILPETMPLISFDENGVCNYCLNYKKIVYYGEPKLEKILKKYRSNNGDPDCILAFSGGRDSSYGLHYLKKKMGMNPIAYTYDWGMITDLGRRNQARMVGKLGIEHVIVSADIAMKRNHIKKNILAWMKKPDLGMVPIFMQGDKQNEYYINQLAKRNGIKLIIYCRGNELETEEFKFGYTGIQNSTPKGVIHNLSPGGKLRLLSYYAKNYLLNPAYINSSLLDTMFGFFSTYIINHDYLYLWHYLPWNEEKIIATLVDEYGWEVDSETKTTWRIDDGTPAFYNYLYYQCQGFTENDAFRSNQIREGIISRPEALRLANGENKPRYESLKWYFDRVGLNGNKVLGAIDKAPRLY